MKKIFRYVSQASLLGVSLTVGLAGNANALTLTPTNSGTDLANTILGEGITVTPGSINYTGANGAAGFFSEGMSSGIGIESGIVLTTGKASDAVGPNNSSGSGSSNGGGGDADLDSLIPGFSTQDTSVLEFDFESEGGDLFFNFAFASEEYNEFVNSSYNDVFGFFLDGENIALIPGTETSVAIDNVNLDVNSQFYNNNEDGSFDLEYDGFTDVLTAQALNLSAGTHTIKLAVGDAGDSVLDSAVFIGANSFADVEVPVVDPVEPPVDPDPVEPPVTPTPDTATTPEPGSILSLLVVGLIGSGSVFKRKSDSHS
jgi:hypothetical protein